MFEPVLQRPRAGIGALTFPELHCLAGFLIVSRLYKALDLLRSVLITRRSPQWPADLRTSTRRKYEQCETVLLLEQAVILVTQVGSARQTFGKNGQI